MSQNGRCTSRELELKGRLVGSLEGLGVSDKINTENVSISRELRSVGAPIFSWLITHKTNAQGTRNVDDADGCKQLGS